MVVELFVDGLLRGQLLLAYGTEFLKKKMCNAFLSSTIPITNAKVTNKLITILLVLEIQFYNFDNVESCYKLIDIKISCQN